MPEGGPRPAHARLFLALWPDDATRRVLAARRDCWIWPRGAAVVADDRLHLTLHFIGPVPVERVQAVADGLAVPLAAFALEDGVAERWRNGIAAWCWPETPPELVALHARLAAALRQLGLPVEQRPFRPHVTLARKVADATAPAGAPASLVWPVHGYALVQSQGGYRVLRRYG